MHSFSFINYSFHTFDCIKSIFKVTEFGQICSKQHRLRTKYGFNHDKQLNSTVFTQSRVVVVTNLTRSLLKVHPSYLFWLKNRKQHVKANTTGSPGESFSRASLVHPVNTKVNYILRRKIPSIMSYTLSEFQRT